MSRRTGYSRTGAGGGGGTNMTAVSGFVDNAITQAFDAQPDAHDYAGVVSVDYTGLTLTGFTAEVWRTFDLSAATPTVGVSSVWPFGQSAYDPDFYNSGTNRLRENSLASQTHLWRISGTYSGTFTDIRLSIYNPDSTFMTEGVFHAFPGNETGSWTITLMTVADTESLATGRGYLLETTNDFSGGGDSVTITNITRVSLASEVSGVMGGGSAVYDDSWISGFVDDAVGAVPQYNDSWISGFVDDAVGAVPQYNDSWISGFVDDAVGAVPQYNDSWISGFVDDAVSSKVTSGFVDQAITGRLSSAPVNATISGFVDDAISAVPGGTPYDDAWISGFVEQAITTHTVTAVVSGFVDDVISAVPGGTPYDDAWISGFTDSAITGRLVSAPVNATVSGFVDDAISAVPGGTPYDDAWISGFTDSAITGRLASAPVNATVSGFTDSAITGRLASASVNSTQSGWIDNAITTHAVTATQSGFISNAIAVTPKDHGSLTGLQGGTSGQRYHVTEAELEALESSSSSGRLWGGTITTTVTPNVVNVAAGAGVVKATSATLESVPASLHDGQASQLSLVTWNSTNVTLAGVGYNIIFWDTSASQFVAVLKENFYATFDFTRDFSVGRVYYDGSAVTLRLCGMNLWNLARRIQMFGEERFPVERATGMIIAATSGLGFSITAGRLWAELVNPFSVNAFTTASHSFTYWYRSGGSWASVGTQTAIDNLKYDDGSGTLATLGNSKYGVHWVYEVHDSSVHVVYGQGSYTLAEAQIATAPATLPGLLTSYSSLVGKIIVAKSSASLTSVQSAFVTPFTPAAVTSHNDLSGLQGGTAGEYYHLTSSELTSVQNMSGFVDSAITGRLASDTVSSTESGWIDNAITTHAVTATQSGWADSAITGRLASASVNSIQSGWIDNAITTHAVTATQSGFVSNAITNRVVNSNMSGWTDQAITGRLASAPVNSTVSGFTDQAITGRLASASFNSSQSGWIDNAITTHAVTATQSGFVANAITNHVVNSNVSGWTDQAITGRLASASVNSIQSGWVDNAILYHAVTTAQSGFVDNAIIQKTDITAFRTALVEKPADLSYTGMTLSLEYGESITKGDIVYLKSDGKVYKADSDGTGTYPAMGLALATASSGDNLILVHGTYRDDTRFNWNVGGILYMSITAGTMTQTQPSGASNVIQICGIATHADRVYFRPDLTWITHV